LPQDCADKRYPAGRNEIRDFVDVLHLHAAYLSLGAMAWAACGKDPGFTPELLLDHAGRHTAFTQSDLDRLSLCAPLDFRSMKQRWFAALDEARKLSVSLPPEEIGCLYVGRDQAPTTPDVSSAGFRTLIRHTGCIRGAWPTVSAYRSANP
jgi:hypothetical protein